MAIAAGRLRTRVSILAPIEADDGHGGQDKSWTPILVRRAEVISISGREAVIASSLQGVSTFRISMRWVAGVSTEHQVQLPDGRRLNIRSAEDPDQRRRDLVIVADTAGVEA